MFLELAATRDQIHTNSEFLTNSGLNGPDQTVKKVAEKNPDQTAHGKQMSHIGIAVWIRLYNQYVTVKWLSGNRLYITN